MMTGYKYFLFSASYNANRDEAEKIFGRQFVPGTVIVNGSKREFSFISDTPNNTIHSDTRVIAEGDIEQMKYTKPSTAQRRNN